MCGVTVLSVGPHPILVRMTLSLDVAAVAMKPKAYRNQAQRCPRTGSGARPETLLRSATKVLLPRCNSNDASCSKAHIGQHGSSAASR
jgi:hypothetical protein